MFNRQSLHISMLLWGSIFCFIAALCMFMSKNFDKEKRRWLLFQQIICAFLLLSDAFAWGYRGGVGKTAALAVRVSNFLVFALSDVLLFLFHGYMCCSLFPENKERICLSGIERNTDSEEQKKRFTVEPVIRIRAGFLIAILGVILVLVSQFTHLYYYFDANNIYHRNPGYFFSVLIPLSGEIVGLSLLIQYRAKIGRTTFVAMFSYMLLPLLTMIIQAFYYGSSLNNIAISISMILMFITATMEQNENLARKEKEAADLRVSIMLSQIAPHFIYNTLAAIKDMCVNDPVMAQETVEEFSDYLRGNLDSLSERETVPFETELKHVRCYLAIEKKRFGSRVNVEYDIKEEDFLLPVLTLQPLVENAVKHGLCKKRGGGTVIIKTERKDGIILITIADDGVGFDVNHMPADDEVHVGLMNVERRLDSMCGAEMRVESEKGKGTQVVITLPQSMG